jgi:hypothetical protein
MTNRQIGIGLIVLAILCAKFLPLAGLSTMNIAILMAFGAMAWVGVVLIAPFPNPAGPNFQMWKMLLNGTLGFLSLFAVLIVGISDTSSRLDKELKQYGVVTDAVVVDKEMTTTRGKYGKETYTYYLTVQFQDQNGVTQQMKCDVGSSDYRYADSARNLKIKYSSRDHAFYKLVFE